MRQGKISDFISNYLERYSKGKLSIWVFLSDLICAPLGWTFLLIKYRDVKKMTEIKRSDYDDSYAVVGRTILVYFFITLLGLLLLTVIYALITGNLKGD